MATISRSEQAENKIHVIPDQVEARYRERADRRIERLRAALRVDKFPLCIEKKTVMIETLAQTEKEPEILRRAKAVAHYLDQRTIFIAEDELIVGNPASKPMGLEADPATPTWPAEDFEELKQTTFDISPEDESRLRAMDEYSKGKGRTLWERMGLLYDEERLWPFIQSGILLPPWKKKDEGRGHGTAAGGWGLGIGYSLIVVDYVKVLDAGLLALIREAEEELKNLRFTGADSVRKGYYLQAVILVNQAIVRIANRFADLAIGMAAKETDAARRADLELISRTCRWVPANPARTFREAMQSFWFVWLMIASGVAAGGRFDQFMYPFFRKDKAAGLITDEEALELLQCLRIKVMQYNTVSGGRVQRQKWAGMARWNNWVIGGVTRDGQDASNELTYLILEAARRCRTPHHTITLRVHEGTPEPLMVKALEVAKTGIGMPAFVSDKSYLHYLRNHDVPLEDARDYALGGCLDAHLPGKSRTNAAGLFIVPLVFEITLHDGMEPRTGKQLGLQTGPLESFRTYEDLVSAFKTQLAHFVGLAAEEHNVQLMAQRELTPDAFHSSLMDDGIKAGKDALDREMPFENGSVLNPVGMINVADSLAAIKKLVFDDKQVTLAELKAALAANWEGHEPLRKLCLSAPKYGNGDRYVDSLAGELYRYWCETVEMQSSAFGGKMRSSGISITSYGPGGALTGPTPDGRRAGENLADGTISAEQGKDVNGPTALIRSALEIDQSPFQSTLLNMKFHPSALESTEDLRKLGSLIKIYFSRGGKQIQFNVIDRETLIDAQKHPERHRDLIVRVAGYSAYFVQLTPQVQTDIIERMEHEI